MSVVQAVIQQARQRAASLETGDRVLGRLGGSPATTTLPTPQQQPARLSGSATGKRKSPRNVEEVPFRSD